MILILGCLVGCAPGQGLRLGLWLAATGHAQNQMLAVCACGCAVTLTLTVGVPKKFSARQSQGSLREVLNWNSLTTTLETQPHPLSIICKIKNGSV